MNDRIKLLRKLFDQNGIDGYILPSNDEFLNEYIPASLNRLKWLTGFECSNGLAIITKDKNYFFTDARYSEAARVKFGNSYEIIDIYQNSPWEFIKGLDLIFGVAPELITQRPVIDNLKYISELIDQIWLRTKYNQSSKYFLYDIKYTGASFGEKLQLVLNKMQEAGAQYLVITSPDIICWLTNLRGNDELYTPIILCYAIVTLDGKLELYLFNQEAQIPVIEGVTIYNFDQFLGRIKGLNKVMLDLKLTPMSVTTELKGRSINCDNPCIALQAIKNQTEIENAKQIHILDAVAICKLLAWIGEGIDEQSILAKANEFRAESDRFFSPSFETIAGFGKNGAIMHYHIRPETNAIIEGNGLLLIDSGGQYFGGTTDITRTIAIGTPTKEQIRAYTIVLKGHLALSHAEFDYGLMGKDLDSIARAPLLAHGMDYAHATGHGVGNFLGVHEYPAINSRSNTVIEKGMIIANEPGYYQIGEFGIRIENVCVVKQKANNKLATENLTLVPYDHRLIDFSLLSPEELKWLRDYYTKIQRELSPYLEQSVLDKLCYLYS